MTQLIKAYYPGYMITDHRSRYSGKREAFKLIVKHFLNKNKCKPLEPFTQISESICHHCPFGAYILQKKGPGKDILVAHLTFYLRDIVRKLFQSVRFY